MYYFIIYTCNKTKIHIQKCNFVVLWSTVSFIKYKFTFLFQCSVTCGLGVESRLVFCVEAPNSQIIVDDSLCQANLKPAATRACDTGVECPNQ